MEIVLVVVLALLVLAGIWFVVSYNRFVGQRNLIAESWRQVDVELQRRHDLVPNLVEAVTASARFEQATLQQVVQARAAAVAARDAGRGAQVDAEQQLTGALRGFFALAESYPELQSSQTSCTCSSSLPRPRTASPPGAASTTPTSARTTRAPARSRPA